MKTNQDFIFVSGNMNKVRWLEKFLGRTINHEKLDLKEIQSLDPMEVVKEKTQEAYRILKQPILIEDTALKFAALGNLPGPFVKFFLEEIGNEGLCRLLDAFEDKSAAASVIYGLYNGKTFQSFGAEKKGSISNEPKGKNGHGWDPIFIPAGQKKTYGEMSETEYTQYSTRNDAVQKLKKFYEGNI